MVFCAVQFSMNAQYGRIVRRNVQIRRLVLQHHVEQDINLGHGHPLWA